MKKMQVLAVAVISFVATFFQAPQVLAAGWVEAGVNMDAVPWEIFCPNVAPVELKTGAGNCPRSHPASHKHRKFDGFGMDIKEPKPNCARAEKEYARLISPRVNTTPQSKTRNRWGKCIGAFSRELTRREREKDQGSYKEPFEVWRARYFGDYLYQQKEAASR